MKRLAALALSFAAAWTAPAGSIARAAWPERPVKLVIPYGPGGPNDTVGRPWADRLGQVLGQPFVIDNRGGASGMIGSEAVSRSAPDGYTFLLASTGTMTISTQTLKINFNPTTDFTPVARVGDIVPGFVAHPSMPFSTLPEMVAYAKANPGKLAYGSAGTGTATHLQIESLKQKTGIDILFVPYRGSADAMNDLLPGNIQLMADIIALPHVKAGKLKILAVPARQRHPDFPNTPTFAEAGYGGTEVLNWYGIYGPANVPADIVKRLNDVVREESAKPDMIQRMQTANAILVTQSPAELKQSFLDDYARNGALIKTVGIKAE